MVLLVIVILWSCLVCRDELVLAQTPDPCPASYERGYDGQCYLFAKSSTNRTTWNGARESCRQGDADSDLVIISNDDELTYVKNKTVMAGIWWIGYSDLSVEAIWRWVDCNESTPWHQSLWADNQPNNGIEDCAAFLGDTGDLADYECSRDYSFICEISPKGFTVENTNVQEVDAIAVNETTVRVTWDVSPYNCDITGYTVYYQKYGNSNVNGSSLISGGNATETVINGLATHTMWQVYVAAVHIQQGELDQVGPVDVWLGSCPEWHLPGPNGSCYWFYHEVNDTGWWYYRRGACQNRGSDLVIINNQEELDYILNQTETLAPGQFWWIGYYDVSVEGTWQWVDCSDTSDWQSTLWAPGEPAEAEDCGTLHGSTGQLSGEICDKKFNFICEVSHKEFTITDTNVQKVDAVAINETTIKVTWDVSPYNCDIFGYRVYYEQYQEPSNTGSVHVYGGNSAEVILYSLTTNVWWEIYVAALHTNEELDKVGPAEVWLGSCPEWHVPGPNGSCYWFYHDVNDTGWWYYRRGACQNRGSDLVIINNQEELDYILNQTETLAPGQFWWIGYYDVSVEGTWQWVDCSDTSDWQSTLWAPGEPAEAEDCGTLHGSTGQLSGEICDNKFNFICEVSHKEFTITDTNVQKVDAGAINETTIKVTWDVSPYNCDIFGYRVYYEQYQEPSNTGSVHVYGGNSTEVILYSLRTNVWWEIYVAALHTNEELDKVGPAEVWLGSCPEWHVPGPNGSCYWFYHDVNDTGWWYYRRGACQNRGSDLVIINNQEELDYILNQTETLAPGQFWWIGYYDVSVEGMWEWVDCSDTSDWQSTLWAPGEPAEAEDCGTLQGNTGQLSGEICDKKFNFICEVSHKEFTLTDTNVQKVDAVAINETTIKVTWNVSPYNCDIFGYRVYYEQYQEPSNTGSVHVYGGNSTEVILYSLTTNVWWEIYVAALHTNEELDKVGPADVWLGSCPEWHLPGPNGSCYWFYHDINDTSWWYYGRGACQNRGSDLVIINNQEELDYILTQTETLAPGQFWWIGYYDVSVEGTWQWVDCSDTSDWQSTLWAPGEPAEVEDCGTLHGSTGQLSGEICDKKFNFICEVSYKEFTITDTNVQKVDAVAINETTIKVTWDVSPYNCDIFGYRVYYEQYQEPSNTGSVHVYGGNSTEVILYSLTTNVWWEIYVAALHTNEELDKVGPAEVWLGSCPEWHVPGPNGSCYWFYHDVNDTGWWYYRRGACQNRGSDLVIINNQEELDYILNQTETLAPGQFWWIGYYDVSVEGTWQWVDCSDTSDWQSTLWAPEEPAEAEDCGTLQGNTGQLSGEICDKKFNFICEVSHKDFTTDDSKPTNVTAVAVTSSSIMVTWNVSMYACDIFGYRVHYYPTSDEERKDSVTVYGGNVNTVLLTGVEVETEYSIGVAALNQDEEMEQVGPVFVTTPWGCPQDFEEGPGDRSCYSFLNDYRGWGVARRICGDVKDGDLVIIDNEEELDYVLRRMTEVNPGQTWWLGYSDISVEGMWKWVDCQPTSEWQTSLWPTDEPRVGAEDCGYIREQGDTTEVRAAICDETKYIMCEVNDKGFLPEDGNARDVRASPLTPASFEVKWDISPNNCDMIGYSVYYSKEATPSNEDFVTLYGGDVRDAVIKVATVTEDTVYLVSVAGLNWLSMLDRVGPARVTLTPGSDCGADFPGLPSGMVTSPNFPDAYPNNADCVWLIKLQDETARVQLNFITFDLEQDHDFLIIGDGPTENENTLMKLTGQLEAPSVDGPSNEMWLRFTSDESVSGQGFRASFSSKEGDPLTTRVYETTDTLEFIVFNRNVGWFSSLNQVQLASSIAEVLNRYNIPAQLGSRQQGVFDASDVVFVRFYNVDTNLHIDTWVRDATSTDPETPLDPSTVLSAISAESEYFQSAMGTTFDYKVQLSQPRTTPDTTPPGLADWAIPVISVGALLCLILIGSVLFRCDKIRRENENERDNEDQIFDINEDKSQADGIRNSGYQSHEEVDVPAVTEL